MEPIMSSKLPHRACVGGAVLCRKGRGQGLCGRGCAGRALQEGAWTGPLWEGLCWRGFAGRGVDRAFVGGAVLEGFAGRGVDRAFVGEGPVLQQDLCLGGVQL